jgi:hypothetical protein
VKQELQHLKENDDVNRKDTQRVNIPQRKTLFRDKILVHSPKKKVLTTIGFLLEILSKTMEL